jgi:hypothetical protein
MPIIASKKPTKLLIVNRQFQLTSSNIKHSDFSAKDIHTWEAILKELLLGPEFPCCPCPAGLRSQVLGLRRHRCRLRLAKNPDPPG